MKRAVSIAITLWAAALTAAQQPQIQNARLETRQTSSVEREVTTLAAGAGDEAAWIGWRVPMVDGERSLCCWYNYGDFGNTVSVRGCSVEPTATERTPPQITPPTGPVALEAGTGLIVMIRVVNHHVERLHVHSDDCQLDAGGRTVYWLTGVTPAESLKYLETLTRPESLDWMSVSGRRQIAQEAVSAIALHRDAGADPILDRLVTGDRDVNLQRQAASNLGRLRGRHGFDTLRQLIGTERNAELRRSFASALGQTHETQTPDVLLALARSDADPKIRAEAIYWYPQRAGAAGAANVTAIIAKDTDDSVKRRGVSGLAQLPKDQGVPILIDLARSSQDLAVRKEAVSALGRSKDPRATVFLQGLLK